MKTTTKILAGITVSAALVLLPFAAAVGAQSASTGDAGNTNPDVNVTVGSGITIAVSGNAEIGTVAAGTGVHTGSHTVTVATNHASGYSLTMEGEDTKTSLIGPGGAEIAANGAPSSAPVALGADEFGFSINPQGTPTTFAGLTSLGVAQSIGGGSGATSGENTVVTWGVNPVAAAPGAYTQSVIYTAIAGN